MEFADGSEVMVYLDYKNLKNHCLHCHRLSHEKKDCPGLYASNDKQIPAASTRKDPPGSSFTATSPQKDHRSGQRELYPRQMSSASYHSNRPLSTRRYAERTQRENSPSNSGFHSHSRPRYEVSQSKARSQVPKFQSRETREFIPGKDKHVRGREDHSWQWREKSKSVSLQRQEVSDTSRTRRPPLERNLDTNGFSPRLESPLRPSGEIVVHRALESHIPLPIPTTEEVMGELREVTVQYMACADPNESAARRARVMQSESRDMMAETAALIIASAAESYGNAGLQVSTSVQRTLASLEPLEYQEEEATFQAPIIQKKRGRPPLNKQATKSSINLTGAKSQKRNLVLAQGSPKRKPGLASSLPPSEENVASTPVRSGGSRDPATQAGDNPGRSKQQKPKTKIIPAIKKGGVDFQNPPKPLP